jgi:Uma2 family endonuclease
MDDLATRPLTRMRFAEFAAFYATRPHKQRWELIDGEAIMMPLPSRLHQRIADSIQDLLKARLRIAQPNWYPDGEIGIRAPEHVDWAPEPDVTVADMDIAEGEIWAERFYFVVEVLSSDRQDVLAKKRDYYRSHASCRGFMFVKQTAQHLELCVGRDGRWTTSELVGRDDPIDIPDIGVIGTLNDCYVTTHLEKV